MEIERKRGTGFALFSMRVDLRLWNALGAEQGTVSKSYSVIDEPPVELAACLFELLAAGSASTAEAPG